jgi:late competence protein required for DNA uptake (superfamily II DNA/RNA helicase)
MAVKQKRIKCARCGERETVTKGERGPASIYCDLCRDEVKREQAGGFCISPQKGALRGLAG